MTNDNSTVVLYRLIKKLKIPVTRESVATEMQRHPFAFSLLSISDLLDNWDVPNAAFRVPVGELIKNKIPLPFIACLKQDEFVLVSHINENGVTISNNRWKNHRLGISEFRAQYLGVILEAKKKLSSGESDYFTKRRKEIVNSLRIPFFISLLAIILILLAVLNHFSLKSFSLDIGFLILFKTIGLAVSILLLTQSIDKNNPLIHKFCGADDSKNCNAILTSDAAKITDELSWSEVGFFYFAGTWLVVLFSAGMSHVLQLLAFINLLSLPYTFYSIYYQWRIAHQWCVFCCTIQAILWLEFCCLFTHLQFAANFYVSFNVIAISVIGLLLPILIWTFIKPHLLSSSQLRITRYELNRFKYNKEFFRNLLESEVKYGLLSDENTIVMGNEEARNIITVVANPFCKACAKTHKILDELMENRKDVKLQLIFLNRIRAKELDTKVLLHFMTLQSQCDQVALKKALNNWYKQKVKNYDKWKLDHSVVEISDKVEELSRQKAWCRIANVTGTPALFINGRKLPAAYRVEDLKYIV
jgi:uncharacterized membrane protein